MDSQKSCSGPRKMPCNKAYIQLSFLHNLWSRIFVCFHVDNDNLKWCFVDNDDHWSPSSPTLRSSLCTSLLIKGTAFWSKAPLHFYATKLLKQRIKSSMRRQSNASRRFPSSSIGPPELFFKILKDPKRPQPTIIIQTPKEGWSSLIAQPTHPTSRFCCFLF